MSFDTAKCAAPTVELIPLSDIANVIGGYAFKGSDFGNCGVPVVKIANIEPPRVNIQSCERIPEEKLPGLDRFRLFKGDILMAMTGATVGKVGRIRDHQAAYLNQRVAKISSKIGPEYDDFIFALLSQKGFEKKILNNSSGSAQANISADGIGGVLIPALKPCKQLTLGKFVAAIDNKIDLNRRINQTLEAMAQAIFKSWFVDFDPVKAKIAAKAVGRDPLRAAMSAISGKTEAELDTLLLEAFEQLAATATMFPDELEESELGEIPRGWASGALGDICNFTAGSAFKPEHQGSSEGDYPFIKVSDMNLAGNEIFIQSANNYVSKAQQYEMKAKLHPSGATVFAKIGVALVSNRRRLLTTSTIIDNNMMSASPIEGKSEQYFLYSLLSTIDFNTLVSGTALPYLNASDIKKIPIVRPHQDVCRTFEMRVSSIFSMMQTLATQSASLAATRDALLPKLLSGELEVSETTGG